MKYIADKIIYVFIFLFLNTVVFGQTIGFFSIDQALDSNPFRLPEAESSWISVLNMGVQHNTEDFSLSYTGNYSRFETFSERNYYWHQAALFAEKNNYQYGILFEQTFNSTDYEVLNTNKYSGYLNNFFKLGEFNFYTNIEGNFNYYSQLEELDNFNLKVRVRHLITEEYKLTISASVPHYGDLYSRKQDPWELQDLWNDEKYKDVRNEMIEKLLWENIKAQSRYPKRLALS